MSDVRPIRRLLVANRGEIAVRIAHTARRLGIAAVGVYSETDATALHVDAMDLAVALGGTTPATSYLRSDAVVNAALRTGCDAVHPGYGFLAENADFAQQVIEAGMTWVGPTPEQIRLLGDKVSAKRAAIEAGVPTTPIIEIADDGLLEEVPLPALVKAAAGGGGRGMRIVRSVEELADAVQAAAREATAAFGDGRVFIEPFLERGRHVEVQILADHHGNVIHLGERECSIQRRNQKILEEAPSAGITPEQRAALCQGALDLARHTGYRNAGTVEFMIGADDTISFLEVNTRLQVEHPVTEAVTGLDLVELQLRVASGEALPLTQDDVAIRGHAIETRIVAEDPATGWLPSTGTIAAFAVDEQLRVDAGVRAGSTVSVDYDSLLAKVVAHGRTRDEATAKLAKGLASSWIAGVRTNVPMLVATLRDPDFGAADTPTAFLDEHPDVVAANGPDDVSRLALLLGAVFAGEHASRSEDPTAGFAPSGWRNLRTQGQRVSFVDATGQVEEVEYVVDGQRAEVLVGPWPRPTEDGSLPADERHRIVVRFMSRSQDRQVLEVDDVRWTLDTLVDDEAIHTRSSAGSITWTKVPRFVEPDELLVGSGPTSPLPGTVLSVHVADGDQVEAGDVLVVVEAMKMEHTIAAAGSASVAEVLVTPGQRVDAGDLLVRLEA